MFLMIPRANDGSLRDYYSKNELSIKVKIKIAMDIASGIKHLHKYDIIHGNLVGYISIKNFIKNF